MQPLLRNCHHFHNYDIKQCKYIDKILTEDTSRGKTNTVNKEKYHDIRTTSITIAFCFFQSPYLRSITVVKKNTIMISIDNGRLIIVVLRFLPLLYYKTKKSIFRQLKLLFYNFISIILHFF